MRTHTHTHKLKLYFWEQWSGWIWSVQVIYPFICASVCYRDRRLLATEQTHNKNTKNYIISNRNLALVLLENKEMKEFLVNTRRSCEYKHKIRILNYRDLLDKYKYSYFSTIDINMNNVFGVDKR